jgi:sugar lactone lactonase YvrE
LYLTFLFLSDGKLKKIYERVPEGEKPVMKGPETVMFGSDGTLFVMTETAKLLKLVDIENQEDGVTILATPIEVKDLGGGRPLGGAFASDGTLYIADSVLGLTRVQDPENPKSKVELVASRVKVNGEWSPIAYADDLAVGQKSGKVYFSDATDIAPDRVGDTWDCLYACKMDLARGGRRRGRLLEYDPETDEVRVLASGIHFANGVSVDKEEKWLLVSETLQARSLKYYLEGPQKGTLEPIDAYFPAFSDGIDCHEISGLCYIVLPTPPGAMTLVYKLPHPLDRYVRTLLMALPRWATPQPPPFGGIVEIDPGDETKEHRVLRMLLDPNGDDVPFVSGITVHGDKLYLGFLKNDFIALYDLN